MHFVILALDAPDASSRRMDLKAEHLAYLEGRQSDLLAAGAVRDREGRAIGGLLILEAEGYDEAERFIAGDPYSTGEVFGTVQIFAWRQSFFQGQRLP